jgi:outer membrane protein assembly factor BamA
MFPFLSREVKRRVAATSELSLRFNAQKRPEFSRRVASVTWGYKWESRDKKSQHTVDLVNFDYVYMPWISPTFKKNYLDSLGNQNPILKYNYENLLIMKTGYSVSYHSAGSNLQNTLRNSYSVRFNIETAGNLLYGLSELLKSSKNDDGQYKVGNIAFAQYVKGDVDYVKSFRLDTRNSIVFHTALGIAYPYANSTVLPFEKRYFSGGANSVRGWSVRRLGPGSFRSTDKNIDFINQSGDIKLDANVEYRTHLFWKLNGALFVDAGNIWTIRAYDEQPGGEFRFDKFYKQIAVAYGLGFRFDFDYFILRFDGGMKALNPVYESGRDRYPVMHPQFSRDFAFHFAVGYPF